jgi:hypothetical protein
MPLKSLQELINGEDPAWPLVQEWVAEATNPVEILLPPEQRTREEALLATQVTTRSPMGAIIYESGGILQGVLPKLREELNYQEILTGGFAALISNRFLVYG